MKINWECLWCNASFQGITDTKAITHVLGKKVIHIKSWSVTKYKSHIIRYIQLQHFKYARKVVLLDYSEKIKASIASLKDDSSASIEYTIYRSYKPITSSNDTNSSEILSFSSAFIYNN